MIQRIQSIYLFLAAGLMATLNCLPLVKFATNEQENILFKTFGIEYSADNITEIVTTYPIAVIAILSATLSFIAIFMFKNRIKQMNIALIALFLSLMFYAVFLMYWWYSKDALSFTETSISYGLPIPAVSVILNFLAARAIKADERLVRSADRIR